MEEKEDGAVRPVSKYLLFFVCVTLGSAVMSFALNYSARKPVTEKAVAAPERWCASGNLIVANRSTMIVQLDSPECAATAPGEEEESDSPEYTPPLSGKRGNSA